jgi:hypothetical protein
VGGHCACREVDNYGRGDGRQEAGLTPGFKRFEVRTGRGLDVASVTVEGRGTLDKSRQLAEPACAYLDLGPGRHRVRLHMVASSEAEGMVPALFINEYGERTHDWYGAFQFRCGAEGACTKDELERWGATDGKRSRGIFDPCGSTRVEGVHWDVVHSPDVKVQELVLDLVLEVYKFTPRFVHGAPTCKGIGGVEPPDEPKELPQ